MNRFGYLCAMLFTSCLCLTQICANPVNFSVALDVKQFGAKGDGKTDDTRAIQKTIDFCKANGGGTVVFPAGKYLCAPIFLKSDITLYLSAGAILIGSPNWNAYPSIKGRWEGIETEHKAALITAINASNIAIQGQGTIDGQGENWWGEYRKWNKLWKQYQEQGIVKAPADKKQEFDMAFKCRLPRPRLIFLRNCKNVQISGITLKNSPSWTLHPVYCENVAIDGLTILSPDDSPNTDGINPDSCDMVRISNCLIDVGDDCIAIKSGKNADGRAVGRPCQNIVISHCIMRNGHGGVAIGSEMSGNVRNVTVNSCIFYGTERGIRFKTARGRGGCVENISFNNIIMRDIRKAAIDISMAYTGKVNHKNAEPVNEETPTIRKISISDIRVDGAERALFCEGLPEMPVSDVLISNARIKSAKGMFWISAKDVSLNNVRVECEKEPPVAFLHSSNIDIAYLDSPPPQSGEAIVYFENVQNSWLRNCKDFPNTNAFLEVKGEDNANIAVTNCNFQHSKNIVQADKSSAGLVRISGD